MIDVYIRIVRKRLVDDGVENPCSAGVRHIATLSSKNVLLTDKRLGMDHEGWPGVARLVRTLHVYECSLVRKQREIRDSSGKAIRTPGRTRRQAEM